MLRVLSVGLGLFMVTQPGADACTEHHLRPADIQREPNRKCARARIIPNSLKEHRSVALAVVLRHPPVAAGAGQKAAALKEALILLLCAASV